MILIRTIKTATSQSREVRSQNVWPFLAIMLGVAESPNEAKAPVTFSLAAGTQNNNVLNDFSEKHSMFLMFRYIHETATWKLC